MIKMRVTLDDHSVFESQLSEGANEFLRMVKENTTPLLAFGDPDKLPVDVIGVSHIVKIRIYDDTDAAELERLKKEDSLATLSRLSGGAL